MASLPVGAYDLTVTLTGFKKTLLSGVVFTVGQVARVDVTMQVRRCSARSYCGRHRTAGGHVHHGGRRRCREQADHVYAIERSPLSAIGIADSRRKRTATGSTQSQWGTAGGNIGFSVAGQRDSYNNFTLDGVNVMDTNYNTLTVSPSVDAVQEFRILPMVIPRSMDRPRRASRHRYPLGTNSLHGSAYEYLRNSALDAKNYFDDPNAAIPPYKQNQFGVTFGGPIKKDKAFFFLSYEGLRIRQSLTQTTTVPTEAMHEGDLSGINPGTGQPFHQITDANGVPFLNNQVPVGDISSLAAGILAMTPLPNINAAPGQSTSGGSYTYDNSNVYLARIDYQITPKNLAFIRYTQQQDNSSSPFVQRFSPVLPGANGFGDVGTSMGHNVDISLTSTLTPTIVNSFRLGYNGLHAIVESQNINSDFIQKLGYTRYGDTLNHGIPYISIPGLGGMGDNDTLQPNIRRNNGFQGRDDVSWTHGRFTHEFGADYWRYYLAGVTDTFSNGQFQFGSDNGFGQNATGSGFSDFLLDRPRVSLIQLGNGIRAFPLQLSWRLLCGAISRHAAPGDQFWIALGILDYPNSDRRNHYLGA